MSTFTVVLSSSVNSSAAPINNPVFVVSPGDDNQYDELSQLQTMRRQEDEAAYKCIDYINRCSGNYLTDLNCDEAVECRFKMCEWCYQVADFCKIRRETVLVAISCLDRYMGTLSRSDAAHYQLASIVCFYIAVKAQETTVLDINLVAELSRGLYDIHDIQQMELTVLVALQWRINGPTSYDFVRCYAETILGSGSDSTSTSMVTEEGIDDIMKYSFHQADLASTDYDLIMCPPSQIAICAISNAILESKLLSIYTKQDLLDVLNEQTSSSHHLIGGQGGASTAAFTTMSIVKNILYEKMYSDAMVDNSAVVSDDEGDDDEDDIIMKEVDDTTTYLMVDDESYDHFACGLSPVCVTRKTEVHQNQ